MKGTQLVICDLDGLLADTERLHCRAYQETFRQYGIEISDAQYAEHWIRAGKGVTEWVREHRLTLDIPRIREQKSQRYLELLETALQPMAGAHDLLTRLSGHVCLALASASYQHWVDRVLHNLQMTSFFDVIVSGDHVTRSKPFPDIFLYAAAQCGVAPTHCVVLEDAEKGVMAAVRAGMKVIAVPNEHTRWNDFSSATKVVASLHDVTLELLTSLRVEEDN
jgi:HAD superfamily hydrolase (TIGR01509 family)